MMRQELEIYPDSSISKYEYVSQSSPLLTVKLTVETVVDHWLSTSNTLPGPARATPLLKKVVAYTLVAETVVADSAGVYIFVAAWIFVAETLGAITSELALTIVAETIGATSCDPDLRRVVAETTFALTLVAEMVVAETAFGMDLCGCVDISC
jgi:hypothetical protein